MNPHDFENLYKKVKNKAFKDDQMGEAGRKNQCYKADDIKLGIRRDCAEPGAINSLIKAIRHKH